MTNIEVESPTEQRTDSPDRPPNATFLGGLLAVALGVLVLLALRSPETVEPPAITEAPVATTGLVSDEEPATTTSQVTAATAPPRQLLGEQVGLELWVGGDAPVAHIDLDTGITTPFDFRAYPLFAIGQWLVLYDPATDRYTTMDRTPREFTLDRGEVTARDQVMRPILLDEPPSAVGPGDTDGTVWIAWERETEVHWELYSLISRSPLRSATTSHLATTAMPEGAQVTPGPYVDVKNDQLFLLDSPDEVWHTGSLIVHDDRRALVEQCDPQCELRWFDYEARLLGDQPPPRVLADVELLGNGTWMHMSTPDAFESEFVEVFTGRTFETGLRVRERLFDISANGRWAAVPGNQLLRITDLRTGETFRLPNDVASSLGNASTSIFAALVPPQPA